MRSLRILLVLLAIYQAQGQGCQPELKEDAASLVTVGYDRQRSAAVYVNTLSVEMKDRKKFSNLLTSDCNGRSVAMVAIEIRKEGTEEWIEKARDIRLTAKGHDKVKDLDPCAKYEIKVLIKPKGSGETRELPILTVGPFHKLDPQDIAVAKFKGDAENYYNDHFKYEYSQVTETSFTVKWEPVCALAINFWVDTDGEETLEKKISNDIDNPTTEVTFDVASCKVFEIGIEIYIDSEEQNYVEIDLPKVTTSVNKEVLKSMFSKHSYDNTSSVLKWDYTALMEEFECMESFSYKLVKDENGDIQEVLEGNDENQEVKEFTVNSLEAECNFGVRMEVDYVTVEGQNSVDVFEEHIHKINQKDNAISVDESTITYAVNPCVESKIVIGLAEIGEEGTHPSARTLESLTGTVEVDKSKTEIELSSFDEKDLKSCVAYKIMLLRKTSDQDFKELETAEFKNPKWNSWKAPAISEQDKSSTSITFQITDLETDGECLVSHYNISCHDVDGEDTKEKVFRDNEELKIDDLLPETKYNCTGGIEHNIPGFGAFKTSWSESVIIETPSVPLPEEDTTSAPQSEPDSVSELNPKVKSEDNSAAQNIGVKGSETILALSITGICLAIRRLP